MSYLVSGCGISVICDSRASVLQWIDEILERGGTIQVSLFQREVTDDKSKRADPGQPYQSDGRQ